MAANVRSMLMRCTDEYRSWMDDLGISVGLTGADLIETALTTYAAGLNFRPPPPRVPGWVCQDCGAKLSSPIPGGICQGCRNKRKKNQALEQAAKLLQAAGITVGPTPSTNNTGNNP